MNFWINSIKTPLDIPNINYIDNSWWSFPAWLSTGSGIALALASGSRYCYLKNEDSEVWLRPRNSSIGWPVLHGFSYVHHLKDQILPSDTDCEIARPTRKLSIISNKISSPCSKCSKTPGSFCCKSFPLFLSSNRRGLESPEPLQSWLSSCCVAMPSISGHLEPWCR